MQTNKRSGESAGFKVHRLVGELMRARRGLSYSEAMHVVLNVDPRNAQLKKELGAEGYSITGNENGPAGTRPETFGEELDRRVKEWLTANPTATFFDGIVALTAAEADLRARYEAEFGGAA
jgi:hypothetical protein